jgi:phenylalanyl-tRNA synthetase alpha chain
MINAHQRNFVFLGGWWLASAVVLLLSLGGGWEEHDGDRLHPSSAFFSPSTAVVVNAFQVQQTRRRVTAGVGAQLLSSPYPTSRTGSGNCNKIYDLHHHSSSLVRLYDSNNPQQSDAAESSAATTTTKMMTTATVVAPSIESASEELRGVQAEFEKRMAAAQTLAEAEAIRREYMGKKGPVNKVMGYMRLLSADDKPRLGAVVNEIKEALDARVSERLQALEREQILRRMESERIDATLPGTTRMADIGHRHPLSITMERAVDIFTRLGYDTVTDCRDSPEVETDYNCFEALNSPKDHPARDMQDTFYLTEDMEILLRSHTSSVQIRQLAKRKPPLRIVAPGRVYRKDDIDATHSLMFHQVEILALEKRGELNLGHLKGTVEYFLKNMFGPDIKIRYRGSYFPFTEPSMEVDVFFRGKWMEVLGCGMVDPNVLEMAGVDPNEFSGFAAGFGVERFAMVIHGISDLREFYKNDKRFLQQFPFFYDDGTLRAQNQAAAAVVRTN